jgi:hypothetical protein
MLKYLLFVAANVFLINIAKCQRADTAVYYFKYTSNSARLVSTVDSADYFRLILPPDAEGNFPIQQFYKNGKTMLIGQSAPDGANFLSSPGLVLDGDCITYYANGKKESFTHYIKGYASGDEYLFYPDGKIYSYLKNVISPRNIHHVMTLFWECYTDKGDMICKDGNGQWLLYDKGYNRVINQGPVKNGYQDGEWNGTTVWPDSIKYTYMYKDGYKLGGIGYDKSGKAYPFKTEMEHASYKDKGGPPAFIQSVRNHLKWPRDDDGKKISIDTMHVSFIIEKDGQLGTFGVIGSINDNVKEALIDALKQYNGWTPGKYYGMPHRTRLILPLQYSADYKFFDTNQVIIKDPRIQPLGDYYEVKTSYYEMLLDN